MLSTSDFPTAVIDFVSPFYEKNTYGHKLDHGLEVASLGVKLNNFCGHPYSDELVKTACLFHDIGACRRELHEIRGYETIMTKVVLGEYSFTGLSKKEMVKVAMSCLEHRASYTGEFSFFLSEIVSSADRGVPNFEKIYSRVKLCSEDPKNGGLDTVTHLKEKFGRNGYMRKPQIYLDYFKNDLEEYWREIDNL